MHFDKGKREREREQERTQMADTMASDGVLSVFGTIKRF